MPLQSPVEPSRASRTPPHDRTKAQTSSVGAIRHTVRKGLTGKNRPFVLTSLVIGITITGALIGAGLKEDVQAKEIQEVALLPCRFSFHSSKCIGISADRAFLRHSENSKATRSKRGTTDRRVGERKSSADDEKERD